MLKLLWKVLHAVLEKSHCWLHCILLCSYTLNWPLSFSSCIYKIVKSCFGLSNSKGQRVYIVRIKGNILFAFIVHSLVVELARGGQWKARWTWLLSQAYGGDLYKGAFPLVPTRLDRISSAWLSMTWFGWFSIAIVCHLSVDGVKGQKVPWWSHKVHD